MSEDDFKLILEDYLESRSFLTERIPEAKKVKRPDYLIARIPRNLTYLGELKAPELHLNSEANLYMHLTKIRKLREHTQKAVQQFTAYDPEHASPWILFFTSTHFQFHGLDLFDALRGYIARNGKIQNDFRQDRVVSATTSTILKIDLFIWLQISSSKKAYQATYINNEIAKYRTEAATISEDLRKLSVSDHRMDQSFILN